MNPLKVHISNELIKSAMNRSQASSITSKCIPRDQKIALFTAQNVIRWNKSAFPRGSMKIVSDCWTHLSRRKRWVQPLWRNPQYAKRIMHNATINQSRCLRCLQIAPSTLRRLFPRHRFRLSQRFNPCQFRRR